MNADDPLLPNGRALAPPKAFRDFWGIDDDDEDDDDDDDDGPSAASTSSVTLM
jgi:hypothetical protein